MVSEKRGWVRITRAHLFRTLAARFGCLVALHLMLAPGSAQAAAPIYFDLGGLIVSTLLYLFVLIILIVVVATTKGTLARWLLLGYIAAPFVYARVVIVVEGNRQAAMQRESDTARQRRFEEEGRKVRDCVEGVINDPSCKQYLEWKPPEGLDGSSLGALQGRGR